LNLFIFIGCTRKNKFKWCADGAHPCRFKEGVFVKYRKFQGLLNYAILIHSLNTLNPTHSTPISMNLSMRYSQICKSFVGLAYTKARILLVFRFIIEYSRLRDFYRPLGNSMVYFYMRIFESLIFWLVLKLEISYKVLIS
jgi:hypothetical protein